MDNKDKQELVRLLYRYQAEQMSKVDMSKLKTNTQEPILKRLAWTQILVSDLLSALLSESEELLTPVYRK